MILILSDGNDTSTTFVIEWLDYLGREWVRVNAGDPVRLEFTGNDIRFTSEKFSFRLSEVTSYWYRRGFFTITNSYQTGIKQFEELLNEEMKNVVTFIHYQLNKVKHLNSFERGDVNRLIVSDKARTCGLLCPEDFIFSEKHSLNELGRTDNSYVTKTMSGRVMQNFTDFITVNYSKIVEPEKIATDSFFPSLVQNYIEKKYELRIFYLDGSFYAMAIFSQSDDQTQIDFRNYNTAKPNRSAPFELPDDIKSKLDNLMRKLEINCGSIDMIVTPQDNYVFLEVNPVGQFGMTSYPCNYNLEKRIAEYL